MFDTRFNLKFNRPQKDACDTCTSYKNLSQEQKTDAIEREQAEHLAEKDKARNFKMLTKENSTSHNDIVSAAFDVQKVMLLPQGETSSFYYTRRLHVTNFTITKLNSMDTFCFLWHEGEAKKGSCEVASCLFQFLKKLHLDGIKEVHLFRIIKNTCVGQNSSRMVLIMLSFAFNAFSFHELTMNYLVSGHSQNENDSAHSVIEKATRKMTIHTIDQWHAAIDMSFRKNKVEVVRVGHDDIKDFKNLATLHP